MIMSSSDAASSGSYSSQKAESSSKTSNNTTDQTGRRAIAVTSNSPSLSPLNAPQLPTSIANREGIDDDEDGYAQDEVGLALAFGAGEPIKAGSDGMDGSIGLTKEESIALEGRRLAIQNDNDTQAPNTGIQEKGEQKDGEKQNRSIGLSLKGKVLHFDVHVQ